MAKTQLTKDIELALYNLFDKRAEACCPEVTLGWYGKEIVDFITYSINKDRVIKCFEIKVSKSDFNSKAKLTFVGHKNYFVMPIELYEVLKDALCDIKYYGIGVYTYDGKSLKVSKNARSVDLKADKEVILSSMLRSMQRELLKEKRKTNEKTNCS